VRAHWVSSLALCDDYILKDESLHHLVNVVRMKVGENLLLLNGQGLAVETLVEGISKREIKLKKIKAYIRSRYCGSVFEFQDKYYLTPD
jgi:16S rRNA U1498 N3-methylase RsmE